MSNAWMWQVEPIVLSAIAQKQRIVGFTSHCSGSGISTIAAAVAETFARSGVNTLLVDLSRSSDDSAHAQSGWVAGKTDPKQWLRRDTRGFDRLVAQTTGKARFLFNNAGEIRSALEVDLDNYGAIVLDLPPLTGGAGDAINPMAAASACDAVNLVCVPGRIGRSELADIMRNLTAAGVKVTGTIVNDVDTLKLGQSIAQELGRYSFFFPRWVARLQERAIASKLLNS